MRLEVTRPVNASPESVWAIVTDLGNFANVVEAIQTVEVVEGPSQLARGTRWRETRTMFGRTATEEMVVTEVDPGHSYIVEADGRGALYRSVVSVEPLSAERATLGYSFEAEPTGFVSRLMGATLGRLFMKATRKALKRDLDDIAAAAERF